jgi:flagellar assembly protein FliH
MPLTSGQTAAHEALASQARLEARIRELERECLELDRRSQEALEHMRETAAHSQSEALRAQQESLEASAAARIAALSVSFDTMKREYFRSIETEVVRLALAIAGRVLHREAQMDPLLLRGPVRVALEELEQQAICVLEVGTENAEAWRSWLASTERGSAKIELRVVEAADVGHCRLQIDSSTADLSAAAQLAEIERGFFDLLQHRPMPNSEVRA